MSEERFDEIDRRFDRLTANVTNLQADVSNLQADVTVLKTDVAGLKTETVDLRRHMGVLHEDVIDRIRGIREDDSLRLEMRAGFAMIMNRLDDHTVPGDAADRALARFPIRRSGNRPEGTGFSPCCASRAEARDLRTTTVN